LKKHNAEYLIVGGYAVGVHGHPRYTGDLDIWLNPTLSNADKIILALNEFGFTSLNISSQDILKPKNVIQLGYPPLRIDLMNQIDGVSFAECYENKFETEIDGLTVNFISHKDLIKNKKSTGRHRDLDDLENLQ